MTSRDTAPRWAAAWLWAAAIYNLVWGLAIIAFPHALFEKKKKTSIKKRFSGEKRINLKEKNQDIQLFVNTDYHVQRLDIVKINQYRL